MDIELLDGKVRITPLGGDGGRISSVKWTGKVDVVCYKDFTHLSLRNASGTSVTFALSADQADAIADAVIARRAAESAPPKGRVCYYRSRNTPGDICTAEVVFRFTEPDGTVIDTCHYHGTQKMLNVWKNGETVTVARSSDGGDTWGTEMNL